MFNRRKKSQEAPKAPEPEPAPAEKDTLGEVHGWQRVRLAHRKHVAGRRRGSVLIADSDAAVTSRGVDLDAELSRRSSTRRPSLLEDYGSAGSKQVVAASIAKRVRAKNIILR